MPSTLLKSYVLATWNLLITLVIKQFTLARWSCWRQDQTQDKKLRYNCQRIGLTDDVWSSQLLLQVWKHGTQPAFQNPLVHGGLRHLIIIITRLVAGSKITLSMRPVTVVSGRSTAPTSNFMLRPRAKRTLRAWRRLARVTASRDLSSNQLVRSPVSRPLERRT